MSDTLRELTRETERLVRRMRSWPLSAWQASAPDGRSRADWAASLSVQLAEFGRCAGSGVPAGVSPPRLAGHAIADQVAVLAADLIAALGDPAVRPPGWEALAREADAALRAAREELELARPIGFRPQLK
jgi:hypothetical protein